MPIESLFRRVASRKNAVVARARALARHASDEVLVEGITLAAEALAAGWNVVLLAVTDEALKDPAVVRLATTLPPHADRVLVSENVMDAMSPVRTPSGVLAIARPKGSVADSGPVPPEGAGRDPLLVCAVDVQDPGNVGAIVRVAEAAGATALLAAGGTADPYGWKALRGAMGSAFRLPVARGISTGHALRAARDQGCRVVGTVLDGAPLEQSDLTGPLCLLVGGEGGGLPLELVSAADLRITIPMAAPVESLNVAVATAVVLYEARRQRLGIRALAR